MRRLWCAVVVLMCLLTPLDCLAGFALRGYDREDGYQYVELGSFSQDADGTERPILWRVLSAERGEAYLLSEYILFNNRVHPDDDAYAPRAARGIRRSCSGCSTALLWGTHCLLRSGRRCCKNSV